MMPMSGCSIIFHKKATAIGGQAMGIRNRTRKKLRPRNFSCSRWARPRPMPSSRVTAMAEKRTVNHRSFQKRLSVNRIV